MNRRRLLSRASLGLALVLGAGSTLAQAPRGGGPPQQQQGFEATSQVPANFTPEEKTAVAVITQWIDATNTKDQAAVMAMVDDSIVYRGDPSEYLGRSARGFCGNYGFMRNTTWVRLDEMYVVGGPLDALVIFKRVDVGAPGQGGFGGYPVEVGDFARVRNGKLTEWLDQPVNYMGVSVGAPATLPPAGEQRIPESCMQYSAAGAKPLATSNRAGGPPAPHPAAAALNSGILPYGTSKLELRFKPDEKAALTAVRGWFAAWQAGNPKLLASFVDKGAIFRATPTGELVIGRDALLRSACTTMGGQLDVTAIHAIGGEGSTFAIARWNKIGAGGQVTKMGSFFRVQKGLIVEWLDSTLEGTPPVANANAAACQTVNTTLAGFAPANAPAPGPGGALPGALAPAGGGAAGAPAPAGAVPAPAGI